VEVLFALERAAHLIGTYLESTLAELGITQGEAHVLAQVVEHGPISIATLHHEFGHKRSTLTNIIDRLERRKLVRRAVNPLDRRSFVVHPTAAGRRTARPLLRALDRLDRELTATADKRDVSGIPAVAGALEVIVEQQERARTGERA
jgi:DNA-binding MarR family transcriptional regulator